MWSGILHRDMSQERGGAYRAKHDPSTRPRHAVIATLAEVTNTDPTELEVSIFESVELEAFDALLLHAPATNVSVTFTFEGNRTTVRLDEDRHVIVAIERPSE